MLGLLLIYFIGKYFYNLADKYNKSKWGFAILGVVTYYFGTFIAGIGYYMFNIFDVNATGRMNDLLVGLAALPFGLLFAYILYYFLEKHWKETTPTTTSQIDQIGKH